MRSISVFWQLQLPWLCNDHTKAGSQLLFEVDKSGPRRARRGGARISVARAPRSPPPTGFPAFYL